MPAYLRIDTDTLHDAIGYPTVRAAVTAFRNSSRTPTTPWPWALAVGCGLNAPDTEAAMKRTYAHAFKARDGYRVLLSDTPDLSQGSRTWQVFPGKREARAACKLFGYVPWNF